MWRQGGRLGTIAYGCGGGRPGAAKQAQPGAQLAPPGTAQYACMQFDNITIPSCTQAPKPPGPAGTCATRRRWAAAAWRPGSRWTGAGSAGGRHGRRAKCGGAACVGTCAGCQAGTAAALQASMRMRAPCQQHAATDEHFHVQRTRPAAHRTCQSVSTAMDRKSVRSGAPLRQGGAGGQEACAAAGREGERAPAALPSALPPPAACLLPCRGYPAPTTVRLTEQS